MPMTDGLKTSNSQEWETPSSFFDSLHREFGFALDVCATPENAKCKKYFTKEDDGLSQSWDDVCWMNPPYGRQIGCWVKKAYESAKKDAIVVCLIPSRTDTKWWHDYVMKSAEIRFVKGRLRFSNSLAGAPFPSAIVIFRPGHHELKIMSYNRNQEGEKENDDQ